MAAMAPTLAEPARNVRRDILGKKFIDRLLDNRISASGGLLMPFRGDAQMTAAARR
jgi:hypothetical protein